MTKSIKYVRKTRRARQSRRSRRNMRTRKHGGVSNTVIRASNFLSAINNPSRKNILETVESVGISGERFIALEPLLEALVSNTSPEVIHKATNSDLKDVGILLDYFVMSDHVMRPWITEVVIRSLGMKKEIADNMFFLKDKQNLLHFKYESLLPSILNSDILEQAAKKGDVEMLEKCKQSNLPIDLVMFPIYAALERKINVLNWLEANGLQWNELTCMNVCFATYYSGYVGVDNSILHYIRSKGCNHSPVFHEDLVVEGSNFNLKLIQWYNNMNSSFKTRYRVTIPNIISSRKHLYISLMLRDKVLAETFDWMLQHIEDLAPSLDDLNDSLAYGRPDVAEVLIRYLLEIDPENGEDDLTREELIDMVRTSVTYESILDPTFMNPNDDPLSNEEKIHLMAWMVENTFPYDKNQLIGIGRALGLDDDVMNFIYALP